MTHPSGKRFELHYAPRSRAGRIIWLLEEAGVPYVLTRYDLQAGTHKASAFLAVNPHGKVPVLVDHAAVGCDGPVIITESPAICAYVADLTPNLALAPAVGSGARGAYYQWLAYSTGVLEPAFSDLMFARQTEAPRSALGWPPFAEVMDRIEHAVAEGPYLQGAAFTAADVMVGGNVAWFVGWGKATPGPNVVRYLAALDARPARQRALAVEAAAA